VKELENVLGILLLFPNENNGGDGGIGGKRFGVEVELKVELKVLENIFLFLDVFLLF
jgi:hypothetical protein